MCLQACLCFYGPIAQGGPRKLRHLRLRAQSTRKSPGNNVPPLWGKIKERFCFPPPQIKMTSVLGVTCETALPVRSSVIQQALKVLDNSTGQRPGRPCGNWNTSSSCLVSAPKALTGSWFSRSAIQPQTNRCSWLRPVSSLKPLIWNEKLLLLKLVFHLQVSQLSFILFVKHWAIKSLGDWLEKKEKRKEKALQRVDSQCESQSLIPSGSR